MSREFSQNQGTQPPLSPTERSNAVNLTEISNIQIQNDEGHNRYSRHDLSQTTQAFNDMKANYEELIGKFSNSPLSSGSASSNSINAFPNKSPTYIGDISSNFLADENAELEIQQWGIMWTHLVSMITQVIPYQQTNLNLPKTGNEKRAILVDLVSKLCENATNPKIIEDYNKLKKKYQKNKKSLNKLREQGEILMLDVKKNKELLNQHLEKFNQNDDYKLNQKIKQLEELLKKQVQGQAELLSMDLKQQGDQTNSKRFLSTKSQIPNKNISTNIFNNDDIIIEEEEEDIEGIVNEEAQNLINTMKKTEKIINKQIKIENQNAAKSASKIMNKNKNNNKKLHKKEVQIEYEYDNDDGYDNEYASDSNDEGEYNNVQQSRKRTKHHKHEISHAKRAKINYKQNKKRNSSQNRAQTQMPINKNDLFTSSSTISSEDEDNYNDNKRSNAKIQSRQKSKRVVSQSKFNQVANGADFINNNSNVQSIKKVQTKTKIKSNTLKANSSNKADKIRFHQDDADSEDLEFNNNIELVSNMKRNKRTNSPDLQMRKALGDDVNQLVLVANSLKKDYKRLRKALGNESTGSEMSIEQLSRIHDSLISVENQFDNISE